VESWNQSKIIAECKKGQHEIEAKQLQNVKDTVQKATGNQGKITVADPDLELSGGGGAGGGLDFLIGLANRESR